MPDTTEFRKAVLRAKRLAYRDSNDNEIEALQDAVATACGLLGVDSSLLDDEADKLENG